MLKKLLFTAVLGFFALSSQAALYQGQVTAADGTVGTLLGLPLPAVVGNVVVDGGGALTLLNFDVGGFFFTDQWTGACNVSPAGADCVYSDPAWNGADALVPITVITANTLLVNAGGVPVSGILSFDAFSPTFGLTLGNITIDVDAGTFGLVGPLGNASGTGAFVPVPAAVWLFGSALLGLFGVRRRS